MGNPKVKATKEKLLNGGNGAKSNKGPTRITLITPLKEGGRKNGKWGINKEKF